MVGDFEALVFLIGNTGAADDEIDHLMENRRADPRPQQRCCRPLCPGRSSAGPRRICLRNFCNAHLKHQMSARFDHRIC